MAAQARALTDMGASLMMILSTRNYINPASRSDLRAWVDTYRLPTTTVIDAPEEPRLTSQRRYGQRDTAFLVDLATMRIVAKEQTYTTQSAFARIVPELTRRLARP